MTFCEYEDCTRTAKERCGLCGDEFCKKHIQIHFEEVHNNNNPGPVRRKISMSRDESSGIRLIAKIAISVTIVLIILAVLFGGTKVVPAGYKGVVVNSPAGPDTTEIDEGWQFNINFMLSDIELVEYRTQTVNFVGSDEKDDDKGSIAVSSKDNILIYMDFSIIYHIDEEYVSDLVIENGLNYQDRIIQPVARSVPRDIASKYNAMDIRGERRGEVEYAISENVTTALAKKYIVVEQFAMRDIRLPAQLENAIEQKKVAEQNVLTQQYNLQAEQYVANKSVVRMNAQAMAMVINASAFANSTVIRAEGQAHAIEVVMNSLASPDINNTTRDYLSWLYMQALTDPNTRISYIIVPSDGGIPVLIDVKDEKP